MVYSRLGSGARRLIPYDPWDKNRVYKVNRLIRSLYYVVKELEEEFVDEYRKFTLDGHLVGSIGEVVAAYSYNHLFIWPEIVSRWHKNP